MVGSIDEDKLQAQAFTRERKLAVAERSYELLTGKYGIPPEDIIIDPLVFPCATGDANYIGAAVETIEGVRLVKENLPYAKTMLGISNVSFGLPAAAREVVNSVFLYYCTKAGLDLAIVNAEKLERFASHSGRGAAAGREPAVQLAAGGCRGRGTAHGARRTGASRRPSSAPPSTSSTSPPSPSISARPARGSRQRAEDLPLDQRLANYIIEGTKDGLVADLDRKLRRGRRAARHHQRAADGRHGRGRPAVQQQRADRGRGAAIGRGHEGRGQPSRAVHGERPKPPRAAR